MASFCQPGFGDGQQRCEGGVGSFPDAKQHPQREDLSFQPTFRNLFGGSDSGELGRGISAGFVLPFDFFQSRSFPMFPFPVSRSKFLVTNSLFADKAGNKINKTIRAKKALEQEAFDRKGFFTFKDLSALFCFGFGGGIGYSLP